MSPLHAPRSRYLTSTLLRSCLPRACTWSRNSSSTSRWKQRQGQDAYAREARVQGLKSRAAFKLIELDAKHKLFSRGQTVVDLGYAPGSWSQVAVERTKPNGLIIGIDLIPAQPPRGVNTIQGDFLSPVVQKLVKNFVAEAHRRRRLKTSSPVPDAVPEGSELDRPSYIDMERQASRDVEAQQADADKPSSYRVVDVVLSDMLMNTSGVAFRDHSGSMDLCAAALQFASDTLRPGGHFVCKFYQGSEDRALEQNIKKLFHRVYREKPESSRAESKEAYLIGVKRKAQVQLDLD